MLKRLFKPKWQSPDPLLRKAAIAESDPNIHDDRIMLVQLIKNDPDQEVRKMAIFRFNDLKVLTLLLRQYQSAPLKGAICRRLSEVICNGDGEFRINSVKAKIQVLNNLDEPAIFNYVIENCTQIEVQLAAVDRIDDLETLETLCVYAKTARVRQKAAEKINEPESLEWLEQNLPEKDSFVYQIVKGKLNAIRNEITRHRARITESERVCNDIERLSQTPVHHDYEKQLKWLVKQWQSLDNQSRFNFEARVYNARKICVRAIYEYYTEQDRLSKLAIVVKKEQREACNVLEQAYESLTRNANQQSVDLPAILGLITSQQNRWEEATDTIPAVPEMVVRFETALRNLSHFVEEARDIARPKPKLVI